MPRIAHSSPQTLRLFDALLADPQQWRYGYDLARETGLASGTLYPILMRLSEQQLLDTAWEPSDAPGRPPRHTYRLNQDGLDLARTRLAASSAQPKPDKSRPTLGKAKPAQAKPAQAMPAQAKTRPVPIGQSNGGVLLAGGELA